MGKSFPLFRGFAFNRACGCRCICTCKHSTGPRSLTSLYLFHGPAGARGLSRVLVRRLFTEASARRFATLSSVSLSATPTDCIGCVCTNNCSHRATATRRPTLSLFGGRQDRDAESGRSRRHTSGVNKCGLWSSGSPEPARYNRLAPNSTFISHCRSALAGVHLTRDVFTPDSSARFSVVAFQDAHFRDATSTDTLLPSAPLGVRRDTNFRPGHGKIIIEQAETEA